MLLTSDGGAVHDLVLGDGVVFVVDARPGARRLPLDDVDLHVLDLDPHEKEVDFPHDDVLQVVPVQTHTATQVTGGQHTVSVQYQYSSRIFIATIVAVKQSYLDLLYSNSICRQSSMPTSILMEELSSG